jgi:hypothetical protein
MRSGHWRPAGLLALGIVALFGAAESMGQGQRFEARLSTVPISAAERDTIKGSGSATGILDGRNLTITGSFTGLVGPATRAELHLSPVTGVRGPAILELGVTEATNGAVTASLDLSRAQVEALRDGRLYIQIHSQAAPDGNLWGWLLQ